MLLCGVSGTLLVQSSSLAASLCSVGEQELAGVGLLDQEQLGRSLAIGKSMPRSQEEEGEEEAELYQSRHSKSFPHVFPISVTHGEWPSSFQTMERSAMFYGCVLTPFISRLDVFARSCKMAESAAQIARCEACQGYINPFCEVSSMHWICSLCGGRNYFPRAASRYRGGELKSLEETQCILVDYPLEFRGIDGCPSEIAGKMEVSCKDRPLVHVFLIQESMSYESLQAVTESISTAASSMHPDIQVVLVTFSHRLCVYKLSPSLDGQEEQRAVSIPFVSSGGRGGDGRAAEQFVDVKPQVSIESVLSFLDAATPVVDCLDSTLPALLNHIHNSFSEDSDARAKFVDGEGGEEDYLRQHHEFAYAPPEVMIGPALEAVHAWASASPPHPHNSSSSPPRRGEEENEESFASNIFQAFQNIALGFRNDILGEPKSRPNGVETSGNGRCADYCSGIILHLFVANPQDLPAGAHDSVLPDPASAAAATAAAASGGRKKAFEIKRPGLDRRWSAIMGAQFLQTSIQVNIWGVSNFASQSIDLHSLAPLAESTGGFLNRHILGGNPIQEAARLAESLRRVLSASLLATRCVLKLRTSPILEVAPEGITGHLQEDDEMRGVFRMAGCSDLTAFGAQLSFKNSDNSLNPTERGGKIVIQMAFSYDTMVESASAAAAKMNDDGGSGGGDEYFDLCARSSLGLEEQVTGLHSFEARQARDQAERRSRRRTSREQERENQVRIRIGATGDTSSCCAYNRTAPLVAVRRLRIFTIILQCTHRIPRLIESSSSVTTIVLLARAACRELVAAAAVEEGVAAKTKTKSNKALEMMQGWAVTFLAAHACMLKAVNSSSSSAVDQAAALPSTRRLLMMIFGAMQTMDLHEPSSTLSDHWVVLQSMLQTTDVYNAHKMLYPHCVAVAPDLCLAAESPLPLSREAMFFSSASTFLFDSGSEIVLYKDLTRERMGAQRDRRAQEERERDPGSTAAEQDAPIPLAAVGLHHEKPPVSLGSFVGIRTLNISARVAAGVGEEEEGGEGEGETEKGNEQGDENALPFETLSSDPDWLPKALKRRLAVAAVIPSVCLALAGTASANILDALLVEDGAASAEFLEDTKKKAIAVVG